MRDALRSLPIPDHLGLAYDAWAPTGPGGKVPDAQRGGWLRSLARTEIPQDYGAFFRRWTSTFKSLNDRMFELELVSRLLVGHGNPSATDVGLTVHHTWGVPLIPGSALKGLLAHYVDAVYGPDDVGRALWEQPQDQEQRALYRGVTWKGSTIRSGAGVVYRALFGSPDAEEDRTYEERGLPAGAAAGLVIFHDALYVPGSAPDDRPFAADVLTVHQRSYYESMGSTPPNDYDDPNPVPFLTVRPGVRFVFALSGPPEWTDLAERLLTEALQAWGVGAKTSSGYGRLERPSSRKAFAGSVPHGAEQEQPVERPRHRRGDRIVVVRVEDATGRGKAKFRADDGFLGHFAGEPPPDVPLGESIEVWVANVSAQGYTLTMRPPRGRR